MPKQLTSNDIPRRMVDAVGCLDVVSMDAMSQISLGSVEFVGILANILSCYFIDINLF